LHLTEQHVDALLDLIASPERRALVAQRLRERPLTNWSVLLDESGSVRAGVAIARLASDHYQLWRLFVRSGEDPDVSIRAIADAVEDARSRGARRMGTRVFKANVSEDYDAALRSSGFVCQGWRVEFKTEFDDLPSEGEMPFSWRTSDDVAVAARLLDAVAVGDPDQSDGDAEDFLREHLEERDTDARIEIGSIDGEDVAFVLAEVEPKSGWSTLSYFGITPGIRGRGLAVVAHRHGIATMRAMGGKLYHGGCLVENAAMVRVFAANGCREFARMTDWNAVFDDLLLEVDDY